MGTEDDETGRLPLGYASTKTHCPHGHPYDEANTYVDPRGWRSCRECRKANVADHRARRRQSQEIRAAYVPELSRTNHAREADAWAVGPVTPTLFEDVDPHPSRTNTSAQVDPLGRWRADALCADRPPTVALCRACPVRWWCLDYALRDEARHMRTVYHGEELTGDHALWGGLTGNQRRRLLRRNNLDVEEALIAAWRAGQ